MEERYYSSSELLRLTGSTRKTLRVLQRHGLIQPVRRSGRRRYDRASLRRLWLLLSLRDLGYSLAEVRTMLAVPEAHARGADAATALREQTGAIVRRIDAKIRDLEILRTALMEADEAWTDCQRCELPVSECPACAGAGRVHGVAAIMLGRAGTGAMDDAWEREDADEDGDEDGDQGGDEGGDEGGDRDDDAARDGADPPVVAAPGHRGQLGS